MTPEKDYNLVVGLRIREVREALNMTRAEFSEKCEISDSFLAAVEGGKKAISSKTLYKICSSINVSADYFIRGHEEGFEMDAVLAVLNSMDPAAKESALSILRAFLQAIANKE